MMYRVEREQGRHCDCCGTRTETLTITLSLSTIVRLCFDCSVFLLPDITQVRKDPDPLAAIEVRR